MNTPNKITVLRLIFAILMIAVFSLSFLPQASSFAPEIVILPSTSDLTGLMSFVLRFSF